MKIQQHNGRTVVVNGEEFLYCSGTNYLHLAYEATFQKLIIEGFQRFGAGYGSSPKSSPELEIHEQVSNYLANFYGAEAAILFSSGYLSSQTVIKHTVNKGLGIQYNSFSHPSLKLDHNRSVPAVFASDSFDPIQLNQLSISTISNYEYAIIDASHSFGIDDDFVREVLQQPNTIVCGSLNKALSIPAGIVLCSAKCKNELQASSAFVTSSAVNPAYCFALLKAFETGLIAQQQEQLNELMIEIEPKETFIIKPPYPILRLTENGNRIYEKMLDENVIIWRNEYPKGSGDLCNRIVLHAGLTINDVTKLLTLLT